MKIMNISFLKTFWLFFPAIVLATARVIPNLDGAEPGALLRVGMVVRASPLNLEARCHIPGESLAMVVTYKSLKDIRVNPISNDMPLSPTQDIAVAGASLGLTGQIFLGSPCALTSMAGVQELLDLPMRATRPEMVNMCGVIRECSSF